MKIFKIHLTLKVSISWQISPQQKLGSLECLEAQCQNVRTSMEKIHLSQLTAYILAWVWSSDFFSIIKTLFSSILRSVLGKSFLLLRIFSESKLLVWKQNKAMELHTILFNALDWQCSVTTATCKESPRRIIPLGKMKKFWKVTYHSQSSAWESDCYG